MFNDKRLIENPSYGFEAIPMFQTLEVPLVSGIDARNSLRTRPKYRFSAPYDRIADIDKNDLRDAYLASLGKLDSFRFKDWTDYEMDGVALGTASGGAGETMQIIKPYTWGARTVNRIITKPVDSSVYTIANGHVEDAAPLVVKADGTPIAATVNYLTGIITISVSGGEAITVDGEFDVPVRFGEDTVGFVTENFQATSIDVVLIEDFAA